MREILKSHLNARNNHSEPPTQRAPHMTQPGLAICNNLISVKKEIERLNPPPANKAELLQAIENLWSFKNCHLARDASGQYLELK